MFKTLTFILLFVIVFCDEVANEKQNVTNNANKLHAANDTNTDDGAQSPINNKTFESVSEGLKAVTDGAKQIITGVIEMGSSILNAITKWFDGGQESSKR